MVPPPVSEAVNWEPDPPMQMDWAVPGERLTVERLAVTVTVDEAHPALQFPLLFLA